MYKVDCFYDDVDQVYFCRNENLRYEHAQAFKSFGFHQPELLLTVKEINEILTAESAAMTRELIDNIANFLHNQLAVVKMKVTMEYMGTSKIAFGAPEFAFIIDDNSVWLLIKQFPTNDIINLISKISSLYDLFLVDSQQGFVVESRIESNVLEYFQYQE